MKLGEVGEVRNEEKPETKPSKVQQFYEEIKGKFVVLFGNPMVGKTTLAHFVSRHFEHTVYFKIDKNFSREDYRHVASNINYIEINTPQGILKVLNDMLYHPPKGALVVVDSITSLDSFFTPQDPTNPSPRMENARTRFIDAVFQKLAQLKDKGCTVLVLSHEKIADFKTGEVMPRFNRIALRHIDRMYRLAIENGKRKIVRVKFRKPSEVREDEFDFT